MSAEVVGARSERKEAELCCTGRRRVQSRVAERERDLSHARGSVPSPSHRLNADGQGTVK